MFNVELAVQEVIRLYFKGYSVKEAIAEVKKWAYYINSGLETFKRGIQRN